MLRRISCCNNLAGNGGRNFAYYRGRNVAINNNFTAPPFAANSMRHSHFTEWHDAVGEKPLQSDVFVMRRYY
jgi:hypothetical protein